MFPLGSVLFPGQLLPLHIFEPRYQQMLQYCLRSTPEFGVVLIQRGHEVGGGDLRSDIGTVATILESVEVQPGHWAIVAGGTRRVQVQRWHRDDPWPSADVVDLDDVDGDDPAVAALWTGLQRQWLQVLALSAELDNDVDPSAHDYVDDATLGSFQIAALSPLGSFDRQKVLATVGLVPRLTLLTGLLGEAADTIRAEIALGGGLDQ